MRAKRKQLLYVFLWSFDLFLNPTFRNLTDSFEAWAYRNGFHRELARLEAEAFLESQAVTRKGIPDSRIYRLTEAGRLHALGGRDPEICWKRKWNGSWYLILFDVPRSQGSLRDRLRKTLRQLGFGQLQGSVLVSPYPLDLEKSILLGSVNVKSLILLQARPAAGETDEEIVAAAWNFAEINRAYDQYMEVLKARPVGAMKNARMGRALRDWVDQEQRAWLAATARDPMLPSVLLPKDYLGRKAWRLRIKVFRQVAAEMKSFRPLAP